MLVRQNLPQMYEDLRVALQRDKSCDFHSYAMSFVKCTARFGMQELWYKIKFTD
jgi:hypothetical protein